MKKGTSKKPQILLNLEAITKKIRAKKCFAILKMVLGAPARILYPKKMASI